MLVRELIVDAYGCRKHLSDVKKLAAAAKKAVESVGAQVVRVSHYRFQPHGATVCLILKESHFIISTWPEHEMAIINIFLCNSEMDTRKVWKKFSSFLKPTSAKLRDVPHRIRSK